MKRNCIVHNVCRGKNFNDGRKGKRKQFRGRKYSVREREGERERGRAGVLKRSGSEIYLYINPKEAMY